MAGACKGAVAAVEQCGEGEADLVLPPTPRGSQRRGAGEGAGQILRTELTGTAESPREGAEREQARMTTVNMSDECLLFSMLTECL